MNVAYSRGTSMYDAHPENREVPSFDEFRNAILGDWGTQKGQQYIAAPFSMADHDHCQAHENAVLGKPHRSGASVLPRRWIGLDADGCSPEDFAALQAKLQTYKALVYTTSSHTDQAPRFRIIIELSYPLARDQVKTVSAGIRTVLGCNVKWDDACDRPEQPLFLPLTNCKFWLFDGEPINPAVFVPLPDLLAFGLRNRLLAEISATPAGSRNEVLNRHAYTLGGLVGADRLNSTDTEKLLLEATKGWDGPSKNTSTIRSAMKRGAAEPLMLAATQACVAPATQAALPQSLSNLSPLSASAPTALVIQRGDEVVPKPIDWLWHGWIARGKFHISAGAAGAGKTTTACELSATITRGGRWPDGTQAKPGSVLIWSGEDDIENVLAPRFRACGADMSKVYFLAGIKERGKEYAFDPSKDLPLLEDELSSRPDIVLIVIDPIVSAVNADSHKNAETRRALQPLVDLAAKFQCALIGITHLTKGTQGRDANERVTGSLAFVALARVVFQSAVRETEAGACERRIFVRSKSNLGPSSGGFEYTLEFPEVSGCPGVFGSKVTWGAALEGSARQLLCEMEGAASSTNSARGDAGVWLQERLAGAPVQQTTIQCEASIAGHSWATVRRAKKDLHIQAHKSSCGAWLWSLPPQPSSPPPPSEAAQGAQGTQGAHPPVVGTVRKQLPLLPLPLSHLAGDGEGGSKVQCGTVT